MCEFIKYIIKIFLNEIDTNRTGIGGLSFFYPKLVTGSDGVDPASSFILQNCQTSCFMWCHLVKMWSAVSMGHVIKMWSVVCSGALHLQFSEKGRPICEWTAGN